MRRSIIRCIRAALITWWVGAWQNSLRSSRSCRIRVTMERIRAIRQCHTQVLAGTIPIISIRIFSKESGLISPETTFKVKPATTISNSKRHWWITTISLLRTCNKSPIEWHGRCSRGAIRTSILLKRWDRWTKACSQHRTGRISIRHIQKTITSSIIWWPR